MTHLPEAICLLVLGVLGRQTFCTTAKCVPRTWGWPTETGPASTKSLLPSHRHEKLLAAARISFCFRSQAAFRIEESNLFMKGALHLHSYSSAPAASLNCSNQRGKKKRVLFRLFFFPLQCERTESFLFRPSAAVNLNVSNLTGDSLGLFLEGTRRMLFLFKHRRWAGVVWEGSDPGLFKSCQSRFGGLGLGGRDGGEGGGGANRNSPLMCI